MQEIIEQLARHRIVPVISIRESMDAAPLADALQEGGLPLAEITLRTDAGIDAIKEMVKRGDMLVGAGTVLSIGEVKSAVGAGAAFVVSPGFNAKIARHCLDNEILYIPGVATPTEIQAAMEMGYRLLKFFPAEALGGLDMLKAVSAPYREIKFMPTGGINPGNVLDYLSFLGVVACGGTWIAQQDAIAGGRFDEIREKTKEAVELVQSL